VIPNTTKATAASALFSFQFGLAVVVHCQKLFVEIVRFDESAPRSCSGRTTFPNIIAELTDGLKVQECLQASRNIVHCRGTLETADWKFPTAVGLIQTV